MTGLEAVCAEFPKEEELQALQTELQELQADLEKAAAEGGISLSELELPEADPIFGRMGPEEAHDKAAADATLIQKARSAERPRRSRSLLWLAMVLVGLGVGFGGALLPLLPLVVVGSALALGGLALWIVQRVRFNRLRETYLELQRQARAILEQYEVKNAKGIVLRGIEYIRSLEDRERDEDGGVSRQILAKLADRKDAIFARLEELSPGCGEPDTAAELFRKAAQAYQALAKAKLAEEQRMHQLLDLRMALGEDIANAEAQRLEDFDRETEAQRLESLDAQIQALSSQADQLSGALGQMGDPLALEAEGEALRRRISRMEERLAALDMARTALKEADEAMRARFAPYILRPANDSPLYPGRGLGVYDTKAGPVTVLSLIGRCDMKFGPDNPFLLAERLLKEIRSKLILVDFHAEATSEKLALGWHLDGRVSALWGTHTHVPTADDQILPKGTGYVTDLGMTGPIYSVLGVRVEQSIASFRGGLNSRYETAPGPCKLEGVIFTLDSSTGRCTRTERIFCHDTDTTRG